jgi:O-acetylserine/cysteine efflux transporter
MSGRDILTGLFVAVLWGLNFIAIKLGLQHVPPLLLGALRFLIVALPAMFFLPKPPVAWRWLISLGLTINVGQFTFLFTGMKLGMPAGVASLVVQSQAFFTLAIAVLILGERWRWNNLAGLAPAACGMAIIGFQQGASMTAIGFWFTLTAALSWGMGNVIMRRATQGTPPFPMVSLIVWAGAIAVLPLTVLSLLIEGFASWQAAWHSFTWTTAGFLIYIAYFATLIGYALWGKLLSIHPAAVVSPFALLVPLVGMSSSALFLDEALTPLQILGAMLVMLGLLINVYGGKWTEALKNILNVNSYN